MQGTAPCNHQVLVGLVPRRYHVTPRAFLDFLAELTALASRQSRELSGQRERLLCGVECLRGAAGATDRMQAALGELAPQLEEKRAAAKRLVAQVGPAGGEGGACHERGLGTPAAGKPYGEGMSGSGLRMAVE